MSSGAHIEGVLALASKPASVSPLSLTGETQKQAFMPTPKPLQYERRMTILSPTLPTNDDDNKVCVWGGGGGGGGISWGRLFGGRGEIGGGQGFPQPHTLCSFV